ncbi:hypothetical protein DYB38_011921, partial [Aphanomyces astaci]
LTKRVAQVISHARNSVCESSVQILYDSMNDVIRDHQLTADRVFNMDETSFASRRKSKDVVALKGSRNVWAKAIAPNFHLSIVACGSADGTLLPPVFLLPGDTVERVLGVDCCIPSAKITTSPKGFMNEDLFRTWLEFFGAAVDVSIKRPILLSGDLHSISKSAAIRIASKAWLLHVLPKNVSSGFTTSGLGPLSFDQMMSRFKLFQDGGLPETYIEANWFERRAVIRKEIMCLPAKGKKRSGRKTIDVGGRILSLDMMHLIDQTKEERLEAKRKMTALRAKRNKKSGKQRASLEAPEQPPAVDVSAATIEIVVL